MTFKNSKRQARFEEISQCSIFDEHNDIASRMKFNFSFFDFDQAEGPGQILENWKFVQQSHLYKQLVEYSKKSMKYWESQKRLTIYGNFPNKNKTDFKLPVYIPIEAQWGRFRLSAKSRLVGFTLPEEFSNNSQRDTPFNFCSNTFYVVFLDKNHKFYKVEQK